MHIREPQIPSQKMFEIKLEGGGGMQAYGYISIDSQF